MFIEIYNTILLEPLFNALVFFYNIIPNNDVGLAIILLTILIKIILYPLSGKSLKSQKALQEIQPKVEALREKHKDNKEKQAQELMALYKKEKINPFSSCFPLLIQLPFFIAVYQVFRNGLTSPESLNMVYPFITRPEFIDPISFGLFNLSEKSIPLAILAGISQWWQAKMLTHNKQPKVEGSKDEGMAATMNKQMMYMMPVMTVIIGFRLPSGLMLYWLVTSLLTVAQQKLLFKKSKNEDDTKSLPAPESGSKDKE